MSVTGKRMQERRKQLGVNADVLAEHLGVSRSTIFRYENGDIEKVPANLLSDIAKFLHTSERYLMGWEDDPESTSSTSSPLILDYYEMLNDIGKHEATRQVKLLTEVPRYKKGYSEFSDELTPGKDYLKPQAAHNDNENEEQLALMQEDIANLKIPE